MTPLFPLRRRLLDLATEARQAVQEGRQTLSLTDKILLEILDGVNFEGTLEKTEEGKSIWDFVMSKGPCTLNIKVAGKVEIQEEEDKIDGA